MKKEVISPWRENRFGDKVRDYRVADVSGVVSVLSKVLGFIAGGVLGLAFYGGLMKVDGQATLATYICDAAFFVAVGIVGMIVASKIASSIALDKQRKKLRSQFLDTLESLSSSVASGKIIEDAFREAYDAMRTQHGEDSYMARETEVIAAAMDQNISLEEMLEDFAERSGNEDVKAFASVYRACRLKGGDLSVVLRETHNAISTKIRIEDEVDAKLSANKIELYVIILTPPIFMIWMRSMKDFGSAFTSLTGIVVSTLILGANIAAYFIGDSIINKAKR